MRLDHIPTTNRTVNYSYVKNISPKKYERWKMKGTTMGLLLNISHLKIGIAKNNSILHVNENSLIRLVALQGTQIYGHNRHVSPKQWHENARMSPERSSSTL
jgi:hypothetical protein